VPEFLSPEWLTLLGSCLGPVDEALDVRLRMVVTGATTYDIVLAGGRGRVEAESDIHPDIELRVSRETATALAAGTRSARDILDGGEVKVSGDLRALGVLGDAVGALGAALQSVRERTSFP
jgi:hypothetical protein